MLGLNETPDVQKFTEYDYDYDASSVVECESCRDAIIIILTIALILAVVVNLYILCGTLWLHKAATVNLQLCISLCGADTWAALIQLFVLMLYNLKIGSMCVVLVLSVLMWASTLTCVFHLVTISINHLLSTRWPLHHRLYATNFICRVLILVLWLVPVVGFLIPVIRSPGKGLRAAGLGCPFYDHVSHKFRLFITIPMAAALAVTIAAYGYIIMKIRERTRDTIQLRPSRATSQCQAVVTALLITGSFGLGYLPRTILDQLVCDDCLFPHIFSPSLQLVTLASSYLLLVLKLLCNALIYGFRISEIRDAIRRMHSQIHQKMCVQSRIAKRIGSISSALSTRSTRSSQNGTLLVNLSLRSRKTTLEHRQSKAEAI